jgi:hypothetical protein
VAKALFVKEFVKLISLGITGNGADYYTKTYCDEDD